MKWNELGMQKLGTYRSPVSRHSIQSYTAIVLNSPGFPTKRAFNPLIQHVVPGKFLVKKEKKKKRKKEGL